ncbi:hypothetical protein KKC91_09685 [bacterium]|nr:hypothetical protein [bacterium]
MKILIISSQSRDSGTFIKLKKFMFNLSLALLAILVFFAIFEGAIRTFFPQNLMIELKNHIEKDNLCGFKLKENYKSRWTWGEFDIVVKTNSYGLRSPEIRSKQKNITRIICIGDSFTMGHGVNEGDSYPRQLENLLNKYSEGEKYEVINAGVNNYSIDNYLSYFKHYALKLKPDIVIIGLFIGNDLEPGNIGIITVREKTAIKKLHRIKVFLGEHVQSYIFIRNRIKRSYRFHLLFAKIGLMPYPSPPNIINTFDKNNTDEEFKTNFDQIEEIIQIAVNNHIKIILLLIPDSVQVYPKTWEKLLGDFKLSKEPFDLKRPNNLIKGRFETVISIIDPLNALRKNSNKQLYYKIDRHLAPEGHRVIAKNIVERFLKN